MGCVRVYMQKMDCHMQLRMIREIKASCKYAQIQQHIENSHSKTEV